MTKNKLWFVYILRCADDSLYTGITTDIDRRLHEHNNTKLGARYTRARRPVELEWHESLNNRSEAQKREVAIKSLSRQQKLLLIKS
ncbi:MAG: putative endonuclease [Flavobacteriales bacterium]|jgi:putative endonuclease